MKIVQWVSSGSGFFELLNPTCWCLSCIRFLLSVFSPREQTKSWSSQCVVWCHDQFAVRVAVFAPSSPSPPSSSSIPALESLWLCVSALLLRLLFWACVPLVLSAVGCQISQGGSKNDHMNIRSIFNHVFLCQLKFSSSPFLPPPPKKSPDTYPLQFFHSMLVLFVVRHGGSVMFVVS